MVCEQEGNAQVCKTLRSRFDTGAHFQYAGVGHWLIPGLPNRELSEFDSHRPFQLMRD